MNDCYVERPTKEEAIEIVDRAVANGVECWDAVEGMDVNPKGGFYEYDEFDFWGICVDRGTYTYDINMDWCESAIKLTMDEYRAKFPCEKYDGVSNGLPPVDWKGEALRNGEWLAGKVVYHSFYGNALFVDNEDAFAFWTKEFRPLRTARERFIEAALSLDCEPQQGMLSRNDFVGAMYDAGFKEPENNNENT